MISGRNYRNSIRSRSHTAAATPSYPRVKIDFALTPENLISNPPDRPLDGFQDVYDDGDGFSGIVYYTAEEEIAMAPACWLWDYLRYTSKPSDVPFPRAFVSAFFAACIACCSPSLSFSIFPLVVSSVACYFAYVIS